MGHCGDGFLVEVNVCVDEAVEDEEVALIFYLVGVQIVTGQVGRRNEMVNFSVVDEEGPGLGLPRSLDDDVELITASFWCLFIAGF